MVDSSSEEGETVVNGMSYSGRDSENANSAIVVSIPVTDYPSDHPLAGIEFQRMLERRAYEAGKGKIPAQRYGEFISKVTGETDVKNNPSFVNPVFKGAYEWTDLSGIFDAGINKLFVDGMTKFGRTIKDFDDPGVIMAGVESRTSSPVRIPRGDSLEASISGIIPLGEGAGYAGGITSAAIDGIRGAEVIIKKFSSV